MTAARLIVAAALWLAAEAASAQTTVTVQSGEHNGFTRLALNFGSPMNWEITRSVDGYVLSVEPQSLRYDLSRVYQRIGRERLSAVWADPEEGTLQLSVACACHALPFEYRPGILVIDLRDGPPPAGSSFELGANGQPMPILAQRAPLRPRERPTRSEPYAVGGAGGYDWIALATGAPMSPRPEATTTPPPAPFREDDVIALSSEGMADLRRALLYDLARGAADGVVDLALIPPVNSSLATEGHRQVETRQADSLSEMIAVATEDRRADGMTAEGSRCIGDDRLDISAWGDPRPVAEALGPLTARLYGEFDRVDVEAAGRAIRYLLSLGFGAEATGMIGALGMPEPETRVWASMARSLDGETDEDGAFSGMAACDTAAALWSVLALPEVPQDMPVNTSAVLRAFSDLPPHLRRHLGMALSDRMLSRGDTATVRQVLKAMERIPGEPAPGTMLVDAGLDAATGEALDLDALSRLRAKTGPEGARATIALIRASLDADQAVDQALIAEAEARLTEFAAMPEAPMLQQALAEALASQGDFASAFALTPPQSAESIPVWAILARKGDLAAVLERAVLSSPTGRPALPPAVRQALARRLVEAGFAESALMWTGAVTAGGQALPATLEPSDRLLSAEAELLRRNPLGALRQLEGMEGPQEDALRLRALVALEDERAESLAVVLGDDTTVATLARHTGDWNTVAEVGPELWGKAAIHSGPVKRGEAPPLAQSRALLAESAAARADIEALLNATALEP